MFTSVSGYTMEDANDLRDKGAAQNIEVGITKKTLLVRALEEAGTPVSRDTLSGSILTAFGYTDEVAPAKLMAEFAKDRQGITIAGGLLEGKFVDQTQILALSALPSKQELYAKLVGSMNAPVSGFVHVLSGNLRGLVCALNAIKEQKV